MYLTCCSQPTGYRADQPAAPIDAWLANNRPADSQEHTDDGKGDTAHEPLNPGLPLDELVERGASKAMGLSCHYSSSPPGEALKEGMAVKVAAPINAAPMTASRTVSLKTTRTSAQATMRARLMLRVSRPSLRPRAKSGWA